MVVILNRKILSNNNFDQLLLLYGRCGVCTAAPPHSAKSSHACPPPSTLSASTSSSEPFVISTYFHLVKQSTAIGQDFRIVQFRRISGQYSVPQGKVDPIDTVPQRPHRFLAILELQKAPKQRTSDRPRALSHSKLNEPTTEQRRCKNKLHVGSAP